MKCHALIICPIDSSMDYFKGLALGIGSKNTKEDLENVKYFQQKIFLSSTSNPVACRHGEFPPSFWKILYLEFLNGFKYDLCKTFSNIYLLKYIYISPG